MNERDVKFFRPLWVRLLVTGVIVAWFVAEVVFSHDPFWMTITGAGIAYCVWNFFLRFPQAAAPVASDQPAAQDAPPPDNPPRQP